MPDPMADSQRQAAPLPAQPVVEPSPRIRFAKSELTKALKALEAVDRAEFDSAMRVIDLEDRLADALELATRWRRSYEGLQRILAATDGDRGEKIDQIVREWIGRA